MSAHNLFSSNLRVSSVDIPSHSRLLSMLFTQTLLRRPLSLRLELLCLHPDLAFDSFLEAEETLLKSSSDHSLALCDVHRVAYQFIQRLTCLKPSEVSSPAHCSANSPDESCKGLSRGSSSELFYDVFYDDRISLISNEKLHFLKVLCVNNIQDIQRNLDEIVEEEDMAGHPFKMCCLAIMIGLRPQNPVFIHLFGKLCKSSLSIMYYTLLLRSSDIEHTYQSRWMLYIDCLSQMLQERELQESQDLKEAEIQLIASKPLKIIQETHENVEPFTEAKIPLSFEKGNHLGSIGFSGGYGREGPGIVGGYGREGPDTTDSTSDPAAQEGHCMVKPLSAKITLDEAVAPEVSNNNDLFEMVEKPSERPLEILLDKPDKPQIVTESCVETFVNPCGATGSDFKGQSNYYSDNLLSIEQIQKARCLIQGGCR